MDIIAAATAAGVLLRSTRPPLSGADLRRARKFLGLTQEDLALRWGVRRATIADWERSDTADLGGLHWDAVVGMLGSMPAAHR